MSPIFTDVRGQEVHEVLLYVAEDGPAFLHGRDDGGEVVVGQGHVRGLAAHLGPRDPHGDADIGLLQGGCVVDAIAGHGDDVAVLLPGPYHS
jgi:hypothetical protein